MSSIRCLGAFYTNQSRKRRNVLFSDQTKSYVSKLATFTKQTGIKVTPPLGPNQLVDMESPILHHEFKIISHANSLSDLL